MVAATAIRNTAVGAAKQQKAEHVGGFEIDRRHAHCAAISSPSLLRAAGILPLTFMSQAGSGSRAPILAVGPLLPPARLPFRHQTGPEGALLRKIAKRAEKEKQEVRRALRMRGRREDSAPVLLQNLQPALDIGGMCNLLWS